MAPATKEAQQAELHKIIWRITTDLRGSIDGWHFESDVLGILLHRLIFENLAAYLNELEREAADAERNEGLVELRDAIGDLNLGGELTAHVIDAFGDAYEYLMHGEFSDRLRTFRGAR